MSAVRGLVRTVAADPRPISGLAIAMTGAVAVLSVVVSGVLRLTAMSGGAAERAGDVDAFVEPIMQLTLLAAVVACFAGTRAFAMSLARELRGFHMIGVPARSIHAFGVVAIAAGAVVAATVTATVFPALADRWAIGAAEQLSVQAAPASSPGAAVAAVAVALAVVCASGWCSGVRAVGASRGRRDRPGRHGRNGPLIAAGLIAATFLAPTSLAIVFAPMLIEHVDTSAADRLALLRSVDAPLVVLSAAVFGFVGGAVVASRDIARLIIGTAAHALRRGPVAPHVGLRVAASRADRFAPVIAVSAGVTGLLVAHAVTSAAVAPGSARAGAGLDELAVTLGPTLAIAGCGAIAASAAQSRGTGSDLRTLARQGLAPSGSVAAVLVAALAVAVVGSAIGIGAVAAAFASASIAGLDSGVLQRMDITLPVVGIVITTTTVGAVFLVSELIGTALRRTHP